MTVRHTDAMTVQFKRRKDRLFKNGFEWFYHIREGQRGPFPTREAAQQDLAEYLRTIRFIADNPDSLPDEVDADEITHIEIKPLQY